jgi:hypothetical protein
MRLPRAVRQPACLLVLLGLPLAAAAVNVEFRPVADGVDGSAAVKSFDAQPFMRLLNAAELMPGSASRTYLELERE